MKKLGDKINNRWHWFLNYIKQLEKNTRPLLSFIRIILQFVEFFNKF